MPSIEERVDVVKKHLEMSLEWKGEREGQGERFQAMTYTGGASMLWTALHLCAEPMSEAAENPSPVSSGVLVTVKLYHTLAET